MRLRHKVTIQVGNSAVIQGARMKLPARLLRFLFGDATEIYVLKPGQTVESVDIREVWKGGDYAQENA